MSSSINTLDKERLRIEIAVLQENVPANNPGTAKFKIPVLITENIVGHINLFNNTINKKTGKGTPVHAEDTVKLRIPLEYTYFYGEKVVPAGTKFIIAFVGANTNDIKIIGRYDHSSKDVPYHELMGCKYNCCDCNGCKCN